jgi:hypothetical protein
MAGETASGVWPGIGSGVVELVGELSAGAVE